MKHFLAVTLLVLGISFSNAGSTHAAAMTPYSGAVPEAPQSGKNAMTPVRGWWAVPLIVGGAILYHHHYHRHCHRRCYWRHGYRHCYRRCYY